MNAALSKILPIDIPVSSSQLTASFHLVREEYKTSYSALLLASFQFQNCQPDSPEAEYCKNIILGDLQRYRHSKHTQLARYYYQRALELQYSAKSLNKLALIGDALECLYYQSIILTVLAANPSAIIKQLTNFCAKNSPGIAGKLCAIYLKKADPSTIESLDLTIDNAEFVLVVASSFTFVDVSFARLFTHIFTILAQSVDKSDFGSKDILKLASRLLVALKLVGSVDQEVLKFAFDGFIIKKSDKSVKNMLPRDKKYLKYPVLENNVCGLFDQTTLASRSEYHEIVDWQLAILKSTVLLEEQEEIVLFKGRNSQASSPAHSTISYKQSPFKSQLGSPVKFMSESQFKSQKSIKNQSETPEILEVPLKTRSEIIESPIARPSFHQDVVMEDNNDTISFLGLAASPPRAQLAHLRQQSFNLLQTNQSKVISKAPVSASLSLNNIWSNQKIDDADEEVFTTWENWNKK